MPGTSHPFVSAMLAICSGSRLVVFQERLQKKHHKAASHLLWSEINGQDRVVLATLFSSCWTVF